MSWPDVKVIRQTNKQSISMYDLIRSTVKLIEGPHVFAVLIVCIACSKYIVPLLWLRGMFSQARRAI